MWIEQVTEGPRHARVKLDAAPWSVEKVRRRTLKHGMWLAWAFVTGLTFVGYFTPIRELALAFATFDVPLPPLLWTLGFTAATYVNAGWLREQVCIYMCPYARFQSAMFDADTLIVSYDKTRGEPRGSRKRAAAKPVALGDCVDCELCVQVCPTGIDIRNGLQYQCIGCAHCIDACDQVMDKMGYARGLIGYATENSREGRPARLFRPRVLAYAGALAAMGVLFGWVLLHRTTVEIDAMRDRGELYQRVGDRIRNDYSLTLMNRSQTTQQVSLRADTSSAVELAWHGPKQMTLLPGEIANIAVSLEADAGALHMPTIEIDLIACVQNDRCAHERSRFLGPSS
jgi:cytochrome c oxidase accessory protein FixG